MTSVVFPADPLSGKGFDPEFDREVQAVRWTEGIHASSMNHDELVNYGDVVIRLTPEDSTDFAIYRGWMLTAEQYAAFYHKTRNKFNLVTTPLQYKRAHHIDGWVKAFVGLTFNTVLVPVGATEEEVRQSVSILDGDTFFIKDYVKSLKNDEGLSVTTRDELYDTIQRFVSAQSDWLVGGIAIREFAELPEDRVEIRAWWKDGRWVAFTPHPDFSGQEIEEIPRTILRDVDIRLQDLDLRFVTVDFVLTSDSEWKVIEVGDGQVSGIPDSVTDDEIISILS